jgi:hypothetical protein
MPPKKRNNKEKKKKQPWEPWAKSKAKQQLKNWFRDGTIPLDYSETIGPRAVWDAHCVGHPLFGAAGMDYGDDLFTDHLRAVKNDVISKIKRADLDQEAFNNFRANHPVKATNHREEPRWEGSEAQRQLKEDVANQYHCDKAPQVLWNDPERACYKAYPLAVFRSHIYQEERLIKFQMYTAMEGKKKGKVADDY